MSDPILVNPGQIVAPPDWDALLRQHGGNHTPGQPVPLNDPKIQALIAANPDLVTTLQQHPIYRYYMDDGSYVEAFGQENGQDVQIVSYQPSAKFTAAQTPAAQAANRPTTPHIEGTPTGQKDANGQPVYDNTHPIKVNRDAKGQQVGPAEELTPDERKQWERDKNGGKTDAELQPQKGTTQFVKGGDGRTYAVPIDAQGRAGTPVDTGLPPDAKPGSHVVVDSPNGKQVVRIDDKGNASVVFTAPPGVDAKPLDVTINGEHHTKVTTTKPDGTVTTNWLGPDGKPEAAPPSEGAATAGTRKLPDLVNQVAAAGLEQVWEGLQADPTLTPEQRSKAFAEAYQIATLAQTNANNEELHRQSERNAASNEAKYRLDYQQTGLGQALGFVNTIIKSGSGSQAGGAAFAAIMGLQLLQMQASGINDLGPNAAKPAPLPVVPPAALTDKDAARSAGQAVSTHIDNALGLGAIGAVTAPGGPRHVDAIFKPPPPVVGPVGTGGPAATPAPAAPTPPPTAGEPGGPPLTNDYPVLATPPTASTASPPLGQGQDASTPGRAIPPPAPLPDVPPQQTGLPPAAPLPHVPAQQTGVPPPVPLPDYGAPGMRVLPQPAPAAPAPPSPEAPAPAEEMVTIVNSFGQIQQMPRSQWERQSPGYRLWHHENPTPVDVPYPSSAGAESKILPPDQDYAVLGGQPPSDLHAQAAGTPPWRMTPEEYGQYVAAGVPQATIWGVPGTGSAA